VRKFALVVANVFGAAGAVASLATISVAAQATASSGAKAEKYTPPRTSWGDPDLQGVFTNNGESGIPLERPNQFEGN
jgi:hypothetical protein